MLTGATGLVGRYLVHDLLSRGHRLAVLVRPTKKETAKERVESILQMWERRSGRLLPRPVCLEGDVNQPGLGLKPSDHEWVAHNCDRAIHNAAVLTFHGKCRDDDPWRTNVGGTRNTLAACREMGILDLHYVSTAYVCGTREGVIREDELDCGQDFRNDYEHSKLVAEKMVRDADFLEQLTIYRPAVIAGDSKTGYTTTYHGLYTYLRLISVLVWNQRPEPDGRRYTPVRLNMTGDEKRNIVPVDWVSALICRLFGTPEAHGGTYHLVPRTPLTPREIIEAGYKYFNSYGVEFYGPDANAAGSAGAMDEAFHQSKAIYQSYESTDPTFDTTNTQKFAADLPCPRIDEAMLHRFWDYGEQDQWGKRRQPKATVPFWMRDQLDSTAARTHADFGPNGLNRAEMPLVVGLDISGPGGGQWQLLLRGSRIEDMERGLPVRASAMLRVSTESWQRLREMPSADAVRQLADHLEMRNGAPATRLAGRVFTALFPREAQPQRLLSRQLSAGGKGNVSRKSSPTVPEAAAQG
jgi:nucleoside-diphosphate-sugar epimerase